MVLTYAVPALFNLYYFSQNLSTISFLLYYPNFGSGGSKVLQHIQIFDVVP